MLSRICHRNVIVKILCNNYAMESSNQSSHSINTCKHYFIFTFNLFVKICNKVFGELYFFERFFISLYNVYAFASQTCFFTLCSLAFNEFTDSAKGKEEYFLIGLKTLLFYSVFTYFTTKTRDILSSGANNRGPPLYNWDLMEGFCKILLEWAKAVIVMICLREQGIYFKPSPTYAIVTFTYYLSTEKIFMEFIKNTVHYFEFEIFENCEHLYVPLILRVYTVAIAFIIELYCLLTQKFTNFMSLCSYILIYVRLKDAYHNYWKILKLEQKIYDSFRNASKKELDEHDDVCAICLSTMSKAKITPCNHYFHPLCLKECIKNSFLCPICKVQF